MLQDKKDVLLEKLQQMQDIKYLAELPEDRSRIEDMASDIQNNKYYITVVGEFKRGKSTFINALLGQSILPMDVLPETATINILHYSETPQANVFYNDGRVERGEPTYQYLKRFSGENGMELAASVKYIEIGYPLDMLKQNIVFVDTPGVSDLNEQRMAVTYGIVPKSNAVLFLLDSASPLKNTEREFIEEKLLNVGVDNIIFIANRYDFVDEDEEEDFLGDLRTRLENAFIKNDSKHIPKIELYPLSALMALQGMEQTNKALVQASGILAIKDKIMEMLEQGDIEQRKIAAYANRYLLQNMNLQQELQNMIQLKESDIGTLVEAQQKLQQLLSEAQKNKASIGRYADNMKLTMYGIADKSLKYFNERLKDDVAAMVDEYQGTGFKEYVEGAVTRRVRNNFENWIASYSPQVDTMLGKLELEISRGMGYFFKQNVHLESDVGGEIAVYKHGIAVEADDVSDVNFKAGIMAAVGGIGLFAIAGSVFMPLIGFAALPFLREQMLKNSLAAAKKRAKPQLLSEIASYTLSLQNEIHSYIDDRSASIVANAEYAHDKILLQMKQRIDKELAARKDMQAGAEDEVKNMRSCIALLDRDIAEVKKYC